MDEMFSLINNKKNDNTENVNKNEDTDDDSYDEDGYYEEGTCDACKINQCLRDCRNEVGWSSICKKQVCFTCSFSCERCNTTYPYNKNGKPTLTCHFCNVICDKCNKNICYRCEEKRDEGFGRCSDCWRHTPLCRFCEHTNAPYECERCYAPVCDDHKKRCFNCGTKCMDCHEAHGNCKYCVNDLSIEDVNEPEYIEENIQEDKL